MLRLGSEELATQVVIYFNNWRHEEELSDNLPLNLFNWDDEGRIRLQMKRILVRELTWWSCDEEMGS